MKRSLTFLLIYFAAIAVPVGLIAYMAVSGPPPYIVTAGGPGPEWSQQQVFDDRSQVLVIDSGGYDEAVEAARMRLDELPTSYVHRTLEVARYLRSDTEMYGLILPVDRYVVEVEAPTPDLVEARFAELRAEFDSTATHAELARIRAHFIPPSLRKDDPAPYYAARAADPAFRAWADTNLHPHRNPDHAIVTLSLKAPGATPGDATSEQMRVIADMAEIHGYGEIRISHEQNVILPHVPLADLPAMYGVLRRHGLATANVGLVSDIIACPGMDYCALATARSIPVAQDIALHFEALKLEHDIGPLKIKISGCINACGHHHVGHIGILGLDRAGVETYQITLGGDGTEDATLGERTGPGFAYDQIVPAIERILRAYLDLRTGREETFLAAYRRLGAAPFKAALYHQERADAA